MRHLYVLLTSLSLIFILQGCGGTRSEDDAEDVADAVAEADTAEIDVDGTPEGITSNTTQNEDVVANDMNLDSSNDGMPPIEMPDYQSSPHTNMANHSNTEYSNDLDHYTVKRGDTLMKIAFNTCGDISKWQDIYNLNRDVLKNANMLAVGTTLKYPKPMQAPAIERNGEPYLIKNGDTLGTIADDVYGKKTKWKKIYENNKTLIRDPNRIFAGFYIYYQITEEEKRQADEIKSRRSGEQLSNTEAPQNSEPTNSGGDLPDSAAIQPQVGGGGGLDALTQPAARMPAGR